MLQSIPDRVGQRRRHYLPRHMMLTIVQGLVISRVRYCISVYGNGTSANCTRLLKVVNFATRVITGLKKYDHVSHARCGLGLLTPSQMCDMHTTLVAYKACHTGGGGCRPSLPVPYIHMPPREPVTAQLGRIGTCARLLRGRQLGSAHSLTARHHYSTRYLMRWRGWKYLCSNVL